MIGDLCDGGQGAIVPKIVVSEVGKALKAELADEIKKGLEIRPNKNVQQGFRLASKDGSGYFDCSDEGIMEMLMPYFRDLDFQ